MIMLRRDEVARRLGVSERTSYRIVPKSPAHLTRSDLFARRINAAAAAGQPPFREDGPAPFLDTPESLAFHFGVTAPTVRGWAKRKTGACPHFDFGGGCLRFDRETAEQWTRGVTKFARQP